MPVRMLNLVRNPLPPSQWQTSPLKETEEYKEFLKVLQAELKPQEYLAIEFPSGHPIYKQLKHPQFSMWHHAKKKVHEFGLSYDVFLRGGIVYVIGRNGTTT